VTDFFQNKEESTKRLIDALKGRPIYPGNKEREDILQRASNLREEVKAFREKHKIEDPPEYAAGKIKEVGFSTNKYRKKRLSSKKRGNDLNNCNQQKSKRNNQQAINVSLKK
jgi:hypothetical protein